MMVLRLLNWQGITGFAATLLLAGLLVAQRIDANRWHKQSDGFEGSLHAEQAALAQTEANYRAAADTARAEDKANAERVAAQQSTINQETSDDYEKRLSDARTAADRLRAQLAGAEAHHGAGGAAPVPGLSAAAGGPAQGAREDGLSDALTATEQAIQLDELIRWVRKQAAVDPNAGTGAPASPGPDSASASTPR